MVSGQGDFEEGANVLNTRIWVEGSVFVILTALRQKKGGNFDYVLTRRGGRPDANKKENPVS